MGKTNGSYQELENSLMQNLFEAHKILESTDQIPEPEPSPRFIRSLHVSLLLCTIGTCALDLFVRTGDPLNLKRADRAFDAASNLIRKL